MRVLAIFLFITIQAYADPAPALASSARVWLKVPNAAAPLEVTAPTGQLGEANWLESPEERKRLVDYTFPVSPHSWSKATLTFTATSDTEVTLFLLGPWDSNGAPQYVLYDDISITGASLENPSFEKTSESAFESWESAEIPFKSWPLSDATPLSGTHLAAAWNNRPISQTFTAPAGQKITLTLHARAAIPPGMKLLLPLEGNTPAHDAAKKIHKGVNFGNCWEVPPPFSWQLSYSTEDIDHAISEGFDHIRIPIAWHHYLAEKDGKTIISDQLLAKIDPMIDHALKKNLHVIIDWHHFDALTTTPDAYQQQFVDGWKAIATHYREHPPALWFELLNEPMNALTTERVNLLHSHTIEAIRRIDPTRIILLSPGDWGSINELSKLYIPEDEKRVIVTVHSYSPFNFTHQGASWTGMTDLKGVRYPGPPQTPLAVPESMKDNSAVTSFIQDYNTLPGDKNPSSQAAVAADIDKVAAWSKKFGRPIHFGEFGAITIADLESRLRYVADFRKSAEAHHIPWTLWDWKAGFAYWDEAKKEPLLRDALFDQ